MNAVTFHPIGTIHSPWHEVAGTPIQPVAAGGVRGHIALLPEYIEGLRDLDGFSHLILLYHLHRAKRAQLTVTPFLDTTTHGIFATRSPVRPNPIDLSIVRLIALAGNTLQIEDVDILDETPLLDLKPYIPAFDAPAAERIGWFTERLDAASSTRADDRFSAITVSVMKKRELRALHVRRRSRVCRSTGHISAITQYCCGT